MKKSLLALAVLGAFAGVASAQSSVTLYGTIDLNGRYVKNDGTDRRLSLSQDGVNSSQLGFRGIEDLGGGLKAGFVLLGGVNADTGTSNTKFYNRRSTVSLFTNFGELRLGRDYLPTFWNQTIFDAFGTNGIGQSNNVSQMWGGVRSDNAVQYLLPGNMGGFYGQIMAAASEGGTTNVGSSTDRPGGRYIGGRIGFAAGPFDVAGAYSETKTGFATLITSLQGGGISVPVAPGDVLKSWNVGGSFDFGFLKVLAYYDEEKVPNAHEKRASISTVIPFGQSEIHVGYDKSQMDRNLLADSSVDQMKATYLYNISKRTAMYGSVSRLNNKDNNTRLTIGSVPSSANALPTFGGDSQAFEIGVRHFF